jgi:hypothetical protein
LICSVKRPVVALEDSLLELATASPQRAPPDFSVALGWRGLVQ